MIQIAAISEPCLAGDYRTETDCQQCEENTYSGAGAHSCTSCPEGMISPAGSTSEDDCEYGNNFSRSFLNWSYYKVHFVKKFVNLKSQLKVTFKSIIKIS